MKLILDKISWLKDFANRSKKISKDARHIIDILKKNKDPMTQVELIKFFPCSQAKMSLMITELEKAGILKRTKKGRSNLIKLVK